MQWELFEWYDGDFLSSKPFRINRWWLSQQDLAHNLSSSWEEKDNKDEALQSKEGNALVKQDKSNFLD